VRHWFDMILVVEDEGRLAAALQRGLIEEGFDVEVTASGVEALQRAAASGLRAIILDLGLPDLGGQQVIEKTIWNFSSRGGGITLQRIAI
jgi:two-component system, OmpR family, response regulator